MYISGTVMGESPDCLLLFGTVVGENPDHVCWVKNEIMYKFLRMRHWNIWLRKHFPYKMVAHGVKQS